MTPPTYQSGQAQVNASSTSIAGTIPTGTTLGEMLVAHLYYRIALATISSTPGGWSLVAGPNAVGSGNSIGTNWIYSKVATSTEVSAAGTASGVTWTGSGAGAVNGVGISRVTGYDPTTPFGETPVAKNDTASAASHIWSAITTTDADRLLLWLFCTPGSSSSNTGTVDLGTERYDLAQVNRWMYAASGTQASAGTSVTPTLTVTGGSVAGALYTVAIDPPVAVAPQQSLTQTFQPLSFY